MSRSYKKTPIHKDKSGFEHKQANKRVRRKNKVDIHDIHENYVRSGKSHRKLYPQWDIIDYVSFYSRIEWEKDKENMKEKHWQKLYRRK